MTSPPKKPKKTKKPIKQKKKYNQKQKQSQSLVVNIHTAKQKPKTQPKKEQLQPPIVQSHFFHQLPPFQLNTPSQPQPETNPLLNRVQTLENDVRVGSEVLNNVIAHPVRERKQRADKGKKRGERIGMDEIAGQLEPTPVSKPLLNKTPTKIIRVRKRKEPVTPVGQLIDQYEGMSRK